MLASTLLLLLICQDPTAQKLSNWWVNHPEKFRSMPGRIDQKDLEERRALSNRYEKLVDALNRFVDKYNENRGTVWPLKEAQAVQKAYRDFERSMQVGKE